MAISENFRRLAITEGVVTPLVMFFTFPQKIYDVRCDSCQMSAGDEGCGGSDAATPYLKIFAYGLLKKV